MAEDIIEMRLNKAIASAGVCSRRKADELVFSGQVRVNGQLAESPGVKVSPGRDLVEVRGRVIEFGGTSQLTVAMNKPVRTVTTAKDPQGRSTVLDILPDKFKNRRLFPVGRLDFFSEGLLLLTTDGELCNRLTHPRHHLPKTYVVRVRETVTRDMLQTMRQGMSLAEGEKLAPVKARILKEKPGATLLELVLNQGVNRQIRRMCRDLGLTILMLKRIRTGPLELGNMKPGQCRELTGPELEKLEKAAGLK